MYPCLRLSPAHRTFWAGLLLLMALPWLAQAQCPSGDITLSTQAQVDAFPPGCINLARELRISGADITSLRPLVNLQSIGGNGYSLVISQNTSLTSLSGLEKLTSVSGNVAIQLNPALTSLQGLNQLQSAGGLDLRNNTNLTSLSGLEKLTSVGGNVAIQLNPALTSLQGLNQLQSAGGLDLRDNTNLTSLSGLEKLTLVRATVLIQSNPALTSLQGLSQLQSAGGLDLRDNTNLTSLSGLEKLTSVGGSVTIQLNPALTSLQGLNQLQSAGGLDLRNNTNLTSLSGLEKLTSVGGSVTIQSNPALTSLQGLNQIQSAGGLTISDNTNLTSLSGLEKLLSVGGTLNIENNPALTNLNGLDKITSVSNILNIRENPVLTNIQGLNQLRSAPYIWFFSNTRLSRCAIESICSLLAGNTSFIFSGNGPGCTSKQEVQANCSSLSITTQPPTQSTACVGSTVTAAVSIGGNVESYQWYKGNLPVSGQTTNTLSLTNVQTTDEGTYRVVVSNSVSSLTSTAFALTVTPLSPDYQPLVDLYTSTNGSGWTNKTNWLTGCSPCSWYGVSCTNGRVTGVNLIGNNLSGSLPASLSALSALTSLELGANPLTGGIPAGIGSLSALQTLNLSRTQLGGNIPASLGQLSQLQNLLLNESQLTGSLPASLANLSQLQNLQLYTNQLSGCFPGNYTNLCGRTSVSFTGNPGLPGGGDFGAFCRDGTGSELVVSQGPQSGSACAGTAFSFSVVARGAGSYQWYKRGPGQDQFQRLAETGPVLSFSSVSADDAGTYQVYINYACGNGAVQSELVTLTVGSPPASLTNSGPLTCTMPSVTLTASGGESYRFSSGASPIGSTNRATVTGAGVYSVTVTAANGCSAVAQTTVTQSATLAGPTLNPSATSTTNQPISVTATGCAGGTVDWQLRGGSGQASGAIYTLSQPGNYTLSASCALGACTSPSSEPLVLQIRSGTFAITGVSGVSCTLFDAAKGGYAVRFTPQYTGQNSNPISFSVVNEKLPTTEPGPYSLNLYTDNPTITLVAAQSGNPEARYVYAWWASCQSGGSTNRPPTTAGISNQTLVQNQPYQLNLNNYFSDPEGQAVSYSVNGLPAGLSLSGSVISGTPSATGVTTVSVTGQDPGGLSVSTSFTLTVNPAPTTPPTGFTLVGVSTVSCEVVSAGQRRVTFSPQYAGLDGSPVSFSVVNEKLPTTEPGPYTLSLYTDNPVITLSAQQGSGVATYRYNWLEACSSGASGRLGVSTEVPLSVVVLGNPVSSHQVEVEVRGASGQRLSVRVIDERGHLIGETGRASAGVVERMGVPLGQSAGVYLLQISTATQRQTVKVLQTN